MKKTVLTVAAICLATLLLCGAACFGTVNYVQRQTAAETASESARLAEVENVAGEYYTAATLLAGSAGSRELSASEIYELACKQVVGISSTITGYNMFGQLTSNAVTGTGFVLSEDGYILTNNHVVKDAAKTGGEVTVKFYDGSEYTAEIVGTESGTSDVALLKIDAKGLTPVTLGDSDTMQVGESVYAVGNPLGELTYTMTAGIISALDREIAADRYTTLNMFQLDAAVNSGNSGGPVYNAAGQVIGIVTAKYNESGVEGLGFAIPINEAVQIAEELVNHGYVTGKAYFGITVTDIGESDAQKYNTVAGVYVYSVEEGSCAEKAGLQQGDVIVKLGGKEVATVSELTKEKKNYKAGDSCEVEFYRSGKYQTVTVVFDEEPKEEPAAQETQQPTQQPEQQQPGSGSGSYWPWQQQPGDEDEDEEQQNSGSWMEEFFNRFFEYFGGGSQDNGSDSGRSGGNESETPDPGYRHFGG